MFKTDFADHNIYDHADELQPLVQYAREAVAEKIHYDGNVDSITYWMQNPETLFGLLPFALNNENTPTIKFLLRKTRDSANDCAYIRNNRSLSEFVRENPYPIISIRTYSAGSTNLFQTLTECTGAENGGAEELKGFSTALQTDRYHKIRIYMPRPMQYLIFTNKWEPAVGRRIIALLPFLQKKDYSLPIMELFKTFGDNNETAWLDKFMPYIRELNIIETLRRKRVFDTLQLISANTRNTLVANIDRENRQLDDAYARISNSYMNLDRFQKELKMLDLDPDESLNEFVEYAFNHPCVKKFDVAFDGSQQFYIDILTPLEYYDAEECSMYFRNKTRENDLTKYHFGAWLVEQVFLKKRWLFQTYTIAKINLTSKECSRNNRENRFTYGFAQPHIMGFNCWGNNMSYIKKALQARDYIQALEQMVAACKNINFTDSIVVKQFGHDIENICTRIPCLVNPENPQEVLTLMQANQIYKEETQR